MYLHGCLILCMNVSNVLLTMYVPGMDHKNKCNKRKHSLLHRWLVESDAHS